MLETLPHIKFLDSNNFFLIAGPCIIEEEKTTFFIAETIKKITDDLKIPFIFKASYKKANRSSNSSFTGIGDFEALNILKKVKENFLVPVLTDIHSPDEAGFASDFADILQIPAFLCRQTELLVAAGKTNKIINIKKGQFLSPGSMRFAAEKIFNTDNHKVILTERGTTFGYNDLVVDFRGIYEMKKTNLPVVLDVTHSLQQPNLESGITGGKPELIDTLARAGIAAGVDGIFIETHPEPSKSRSDGSNMLKLEYLESLLTRLIRIRQAIAG